jgi:hypothetical protein
MRAAVRLRQDYDVQRTEPERELVADIGVSQGVGDSVASAQRASLEEIVADVQKTIVA